MRVGAGVAGCGADRERPAVAPPAPGVVRSDEHRFTAELPAGWHLAPESLTPQLTNPVEILSAGTVPDVGPEGGSCAHVPVAALERMGPQDAFVTVQERYGEPRFPPRRYPFVLPRRSGLTDAEVCAGRDRPLDFHWFGFNDAARGFHVLVVLGRDAARERRAEAEALLESLRFEPGPAGVRIDPDLAVPQRRHDPAHARGLPRAHRRADARPRGPVRVHGREPDGRVAAGRPGVPGARLPRPARERPAAAGRALDPELDPGPVRRMSQDTRSRRRSSRGS
jgi:hypothetical protein